MSQRRIELGQKLKTILGNTNVYFQPPSNLAMKYPCAVYTLDGINQRHANDETYKSDRRYMVTFISKDPDNTYYESMVDEFKYTRFDRRFVVDNLYHDVFTVYY